MPTAFELRYWRENEWYVGQLVGVPGVFSQGESLEELEENIRDAYRMMMDEEAPSPANAQSKQLVIDA